MIDKEYYATIADRLSKASQKEVSADDMLIWLEEGAGERYDYVQKAVVQFLGAATVEVGDACGLTAYLLEWALGIGSRYEDEFDLHRILVENQSPAVQYRAAL